MEQGMITCPNCGHEFEMSDALIIGGQIPAIPALELDDETTKQLPDSD
jgi:hypothetical protein